MAHIFFHLIESIKRYLEKGALKSQQQQQQLSLFMDLAKINLRDQKQTLPLTKVVSKCNFSAEVLKILLELFQNPVQTSKYS